MARWSRYVAGRASLALRKLVDAARNAEGPEATARQAKQVADRFMSTMLGNQPGYEEVSRALYRADRRRFETLTEAWPADLRGDQLQVGAEAYPQLRAALRAARDLSLGYWKDKSKQGAKINRRLYNFVMGNRLRDWMEPCESARYDPVMCDAVIRLGREGLSPTTMAIALGIEREHLDAWIEVHPELRDAMKTARALSFEWWSDENNGSDAPDGRDSMKKCCLRDWG